MPTGETARRIISLSTPPDDVWRFVRDDPQNAAAAEFDDSSWQEVSVPHDWAIYGPFDRDNDSQLTHIKEDGEKKDYQHTGRTGGLPHVGVGWYRRAFTLPSGSSDRCAYVEFDGVMRNAEVYLNGERVGAWPYGYSSFCFDITRLVKHDSHNVLAVRCDVKGEASRWYPGAGIYRNARLIVVDPVHVAHRGTYITTPVVEADTATVRVKTTIENASGDAKRVSLRTVLRAPDGETAADHATDADVDSRLEITQELRVSHPALWDVDKPLMYEAVSHVLVDGTEVDCHTTRFGIRTLRFDAKEGFFLNGHALKFRGVCMHHDLGPLGAAMNRAALERQYGILKDMGVNALRTSHNPPAPEVLEVCDELGILVIDEAFDEWKRGKVSNGYHTIFEEWAERDLRAMIRRDRNHPCVVMWSIGNEIGEQNHEDGAQVAQFLTDICHDEDDTRPTTAGYNSSGNAIKYGLADAVDVPGWNYKPHLYEQYHAENASWPMYGSETESCVSSRGVYHFPAERDKDARRDDLQVSSYDLASPPWGYPPDIEFAAQDDNPHNMGEFVWTGFDYLGEPTPYNKEWPSRSSYFGIVDLCGLPKDRYYAYQAQWTDLQVLHVFPHWTWPGREGELTPVHCYTSFETAELFLNGRSIGVRRKDPDGEFTRYRLVWEDVKYEPGEIKVVALDASDAPAAERVIRTAGEPARIELALDRARIAADGRDLSFVTVRILDAGGNPCPHATTAVSFAVEGAARLVAVGNGNAASVESFQASSRMCFGGMCVAVVGSVFGRKGEATVSASAEGLEGGSARVDVLDPGSRIQCPP